MKKTTTTILAITLSLSVFAQQNDTMFIHTTNQFIHEFATAEIDSIVFQRTQPPMALPRDTVWIRDTVWNTDVIPCNPTPMWGIWDGLSLGTVSFYTNQTWAIEGNGISQIWSDAVTTTTCQQKTWFYSYAMLPQRFNADCRSNPNFPGDFFSWCAVVLFANELCPYPWRVPTMQDFIDLDIAMGGTGQNRTNSGCDYTAEFVVNNYITRWGGAFGGYSILNGTLRSQEGFFGRYWSQSEYRTLHGYGLAFVVYGHIYPSDISTRHLGKTLRCVR